MIRAIDTLSSSIHLLQKRQETTSANLANINTSGYQATKNFQSTLAEVQLHNYQGGPEANSRLEIGGFPFANQIDDTMISTVSGATRETERLTDFATSNGGYFVVLLNNGTQAYTRNGNFKLNDLNQLVTQEGYQVLGQNNQPVTIDKWQDLQVRAFENTDGWTAVGNTYFTSTNAGQLVNAAQVKQGYLEQSNVSASDEMVALLQTSREFEANQKALSSINDTLKKATNELGRI